MLAIISVPIREPLWNSLALGLILETVPSRGHLQRASFPFFVPPFDQIWFAGAVESEFFPPSSPNKKYIVNFLPSSPPLFLFAVLTVDLKLCFPV